MRLAREIVTLYHSAAAADEGEKHFQLVFQKKQTPEDIRLVKTGAGELADILLKNGVIASKSEFRRLVEEGGVRVGGEKIQGAEYAIHTDATVQIGKRRFLKIVVQEETR